MEPPHQRSARARPGASLEVLLIGYVLHPVHDLALDCFLNGDVRHARCGSGAVPMLDRRRDPYGITWPDLLDAATPLLNPAESGRYDEPLAGRMGVPRSACARF